jgi:plasmid replication initiation protein
MNKNNLVTKSNSLVKAQGSFTAFEQKIIIGAISMINPFDDGFKEYEMKVEDIMEIYGVSKKNVYREIDNATDKFFKVITIRDGENIIKIPFFTKAQWKERGSIVIFRFSPELQPYLLDLQQYTKYELINISNMKSGYSIRIFELLKQCERMKKCSFKLDELKELLGITIEYKVFKDFDRRVLKVALDEINALTDIHVDYEKKRIGRSIGKIEFTITSKPRENEQINEYFKTIYSPEEFKVILNGVKAACPKLPLNEKHIDEIYTIACDMTDKFSLDPYEYIKINYEYMINKNDVKNPIAYLKKIIGIDGARARAKMLGI